jgi:hypothetical protein
MDKNSIFYFFLMFYENLLSEGGSIGKPHLYVNEILALCIF